MATGKSFDLKKQKDDEGIKKDFWAHTEGRKRNLFIVIILIREFNLRVERRIIPSLQDLYY